MAEKLRSNEAGCLSVLSPSLPRAWDAFDAYLFDIDGTLLRCEDAVHYFAFCDALSWMAQRPLALDGVTAHGNTDTGILRDAFMLAGVSEQIWRSRLPELRQRICNFVVTRESELCVAVLPSVRAILEHLKDKGAVLGVATGNLRVVGQLKLQRAGLHSFFKFGGWSDGFENRADVFAAAVEQPRELAGRSASICVVGDTPADIQAARANGLPVIAVATGIYTFDQLAAEMPDYCIRSLDELISPAQDLPT